MNLFRRGLISTALAGAGAMVFGRASKAQQQSPIKLGLITPVTGPLASYGKIQSIIIKLAVDDINAKGGVNGSLIQLDIGDSQTDPGQAVLLFRRYVGDGCFGVIGPMTGTQWETVSPLANQLQMPAISVNAIKPGVTIRPWTIRLQPPDDTQIPESFRVFLKEFPQVKTVVVTADVREASSKAAADILAKIAAENGIQVLDTVEFSSRSTDLSAAAIQIKNRNPDAILAAVFPAQAMLLAKEFNTQRITVPVLATAVLWSGPFINMVGDLGRNWYVIGFSTNADGIPGLTDQTLYRSLVDRVTQRGDAVIGVPPNLANWSIGYDAILLYADIMKRAGINGSTEPKSARVMIKDEFMRLTSFDGVYKYMIHDNGDGYIPGDVLRADVDRKIWTFVR